MGCPAVGEAPSPGLITFVVLLALLVLSAEVYGLDFGYHDGVQLETFLKEIARTYPSLTRLRSIGKSVRGADLWVIVIGKDPYRQELLRPAIRCVANIHGNEVVGREELLHLVEYLVTNYGKDAAVTSLLQTTTIHLMPSMNPDGFAVAYPTDCQGVQGRLNANSIDLNRNFPDTLPRPASVIQPETKAVMDWVQSTQFVLSASLHGGALVVNYPFDIYRDSKRGSRTSIAPDNDVFVYLARAYSLAHPTMQKGQPCFQDDDTFADGITNGAKWYPVAGSMQDYSYIEAGCYELTIEISCCKYPPPTRLRSFWEADRKPLMNLFQKVHMGVKGLVLNESGSAVSKALVILEGREQVPFRTSQFGEYWKLLLPGDYVLLVSMIGYQTKTAPFQVTNGTVTRLDITLLANEEGAGMLPVSTATHSLASVWLTCLLVGQLPLLVI